MQVARQAFSSHCRKPKQIMCQDSLLQPPLPYHPPIRPPAPHFGLSCWYTLGGGYQYMERCTDTYPAPCNHPLLEEIMTPENKSGDKPTPGTRQT